VIVMNDTDAHHNQNRRSVYELEELKEQVERGWLTQQFPAGAAGNVAGPSEAMTESIPGQVQWKRQNQHHNAHVIYRFRGYFHEPGEVTRRFKLELGNYQVPKTTHPSVADPPQFLLAVDGRPITDPENPGRLEGEINLRPGIHHFEIWATGWDGAIGFGRSVKLLANLEDPETLVECPDAFFDPGTFPENSLDHRNAPATLTASPDGTRFTVKFAEGSRSRLIRLVLLDQESPVPTLNKITLTDAKGGKVLPLADDFAELNKNDILEMLTGDRISVRYVDDRFVTNDKEKHERFLDVAFTDARVEFADIEPRPDHNGKDKPYYERLLRFNHDEPLSLVVTDPDMDVSGAPDKVRVMLKADSGEARAFEAVETADSTGVFKLLVTPVATGGGVDKVVVSKGGAISVAYLDEENNRPGIPYERVATIRHAAFATPDFQLARTEVTPWEPEEGTAAPMRTLIHGFERLHSGTRIDEPRRSETIRPRWEVRRSLVSASEPPEGGFTTVAGRPLEFEIVAPHLALRSGSKVVAYAQTSSGRKAAGGAAKDGFDITVPGTVEIEGPIAIQTRALHSDVPELPIYVDARHDGPQPEARDDRFSLRVPLAAGLLPPSGVLGEEEREELKQRAKDSRTAAQELEARGSGLIVAPGDTIFLGLRYTDPAGQSKWVTASTQVVTHAAFDLMAEDYREPMTSAYVGETLNLRAVDLGADTSDEMDVVTAIVQAKSGAKASVELRESGPHTGIFKGGYLLSYAREAGPLAEDYDVRREGFPVTYGDTLAARYTDGNGVNSDTLFVTISKGADGSIQPFSKTYENEEIGMRTQFSLAEAYLEMAKRHRQLDQNELAAQEYASAKLLLSKAMDEFRDPDTRAHAEYLLGTLTMEEAVAAGDPEVKETRFRAALSRFLTVTGSYPQTIHASRAQYRIATVYEALGEPDIAAQEYVKLAYKYPDSEFLATSMLRLGTHFLKKASELETRAKALLAKGEEDKDAQYDGTALQRLAEAEYLKTASIFGRLQERFPGNELAGPAGLRAGQAYMRAGRNAEAVEAFQRVIVEEAYDGPNVRAQAIYWSGMCYQQLRQEMAAYSAFKRLTYDFPESEWAAYARAQLSTERLLQLETRLELERLEAGQ
jgi:outer membrane protein assembly factor BamD (BamD/ComL family)